MIQLLIYMLLGLLGVGGHVFAKMSKWETEGKSITLKKYWSTSKWRTISGVIATLATIGILFQAEQMSWGTAFLSGYFFDSALRNSTKALGFKTTP